MGNQITKTVLVNSLEVGAILDAHYSSRGRRVEEYGLNYTMRFLVEISDKELARWNTLFDQFEDTLHQIQVELTLFEVIAVQELHWHRLAKEDKISLLLVCNRWKSIRESFSDKKSTKKELRKLIA